MLLKTNIRFIAIIFFLAFATLAEAGLKQTLATKAIPSLSTRHKKEDSVIGDFIGGIILICFSFPILWMNERKQVRMEKVIKKGKKACEDGSDINKPHEGQNMKLVYQCGDTRNESIIVDKTFTIEV